MGTEEINYIAGVLKDEPEMLSIIFSMIRQREKEGPKFG